ncbi:MAG: TlyA family methyltransferase [Dehalococcoidales bacterium]|nr:TlyA family methyltransferase [Dehalococcoidales bacterium]
MARWRLDSLLVEKGLAESQAQAQALIMAGEVMVDGRAIIKAGTPVSEEAVITIVAAPPFVSRGGLKLDYALDRFGIDVSARVVADIGASTGGFTDCLLKRGASRVYAIDVGYGQLDYRLRQDARVVVMERVNARYPVTLPEKVDLATIDVSFISVTRIIPAVAQLLKEDGYLVVLIKPQFEARRAEVEKGGVIKSSQLHARILGRFVAWMLEHNFRLGGLTASPILGAAGNREFLVLVKLT